MLWFAWVKFVPIFVAIQVFWVLILPTTQKLCTLLLYNNKWNIFKCGWPCIYCLFDWKIIYSPFQGYSTTREVQRLNINYLNTNLTWQSCPKLKSWKLVLNSHKWSHTKRGRGVGLFVAQVRKADGIEARTWGLDPCLISLWVLTPGELEKCRLVKALGKIS